MLAELTALALLAGPPDDPPAPQDPPPAVEAADAELVFEFSTSGAARVVGTLADEPELLKTWLTVEGYRAGRKVARASCSVRGNPPKDGKESPAHVRQRLECRFEHEGGGAGTLTLKLDECPFRRWGRDAPSRSVGFSCAAAKRLHSTLANGRSLDSRNPLYWNLYLDNRVGMTLLGGSAEGVLHEPESHSALLCLLNWEGDLDERDRLKPGTVRIKSVECALLDPR